MDEIVFYRGSAFTRESTRDRNIWRRVAWRHRYTIAVCVPDYKKHEKQTLQGLIFPVVFDEDGYLTMNPED